MAVSTFRFDVASWGARAKRNLAAVHLIAFQDMATEIVAAWPVLTGFSRASWFASVNALPSGQAGSANAYAQVASVGAAFRLGDVLYFGNTAAYARRLEEGFVGTDSLGRSYNQRGRYVVRGVLARAQQIANAAAARVNVGNAGAARPGGGGARPGTGFVR